MIGLVLLLGACLEPEPVSYPRDSSNVVNRKTLSVDLKLSPVPGRISMVSGKSYKDFLQSLNVAFPGVIKIIPRNENVDLSGLTSDIWALARDHNGLVVIASPDPDLPEAADVRVEISYFLYSLVRCGEGLGRRKLDQNGLMTAGFGCAVERNLLLSIADPSEWVPVNSSDGRRPGPPER